MTDEHSSTDPSSAQSAHPDGLDAISDESRPERIRLHDDSAPDDADNPDILEEADLVLPHDDFGELDADPESDAPDDDDLDAGTTDDPDQI